MKLQLLHIFPAVIQSKCRFCLLIVLLFTSVYGYSQNITKFEYFIDTDPGVGLGTQVNVTPTTSITDFNIPVSTSALTPGFHTLYIRSQNELGNWTHTHYRTFFIDNTIIPPTISTFNPSSGLVGSTVVITGTNFSTVPANNTVRFNGTPATVTLASATSLTVTVPAGATTGLISVVVGGLTANSGTSFTVSSPNITAAEYFFNTDPGPGNGTAISITPGTTIDLTNINIPTTSLAVGWHTVHVRARDANNVWGFYESRQIYVREIPPVIPPTPPTNITALEFFYDNDPGPGVGNSIPITAGLTIDLVNSNLANTLPLGWHTVHVRAQNSYGWGNYESRQIFVRGAPEPPDPCPSPIVELEYFVDSDPGAGLSTTKKTITPSFLNIDLVDEPLDVGTQPLGAHKIYIRAKNDAGEWSMSEAANFTVIAPCAIINAPTATGVNRCDPGPVTLTAADAAVGETYRWYATETSLTPLFTGNPFITPSLSVNTTYYVTAYNPTTYCESGRTPVTASISGIDKPVLSISGSLSVCEGTTQTITAPNGFVSYTWSNGLTTQQITATTTGSYSVVVNNGICSSPPSDAFVFTVNARPAKPTISATGGGSLCGTGTVTLSAPIGFSAYSWSSGETTASIDVTNIGAYTVIVSNASGCQSPPSDALSVTAAALSKPAITVTGNPSLCDGSTVLLEAPAGFSGYAWSNGATTQQITVSAAGNYSVIVSSGSCTSPSSDGVSVTTTTQPAQPTVSVSGTTTLCNGALVVLTAPAGFSTYAWSNGETTRQLVVDAAGTFTVQTGNAPNCLSIASAPVVVTTTGLPCSGIPGTPSVSNASRCESGTLVLTASGATGGLEYRWYDVPAGGSVLFTGSAFTTPDLASTTTYYVSLYDAVNLVEGNRAAATATIITIAKPAISPAGPITLCQGSSTLLSAPVGFTTYLWSNGAITQQISVSSAGTYSVQTGNGTCVSPASDNVTITVAPALAKPEISVTGNTALCNSESVELSAPGGFTEYTWSTGATSQAITVTSAGTYFVSVGNGTCTSLPSDNTIISSVVSPAKPTITITGSTTLCNGAFTVLSAPTGFTTYVWSTGETTRQIVVSAAGTFFVQTGTAASCLSPASDNVVIVANGLPCSGSIPPTAPTTTNVTRCGAGTVTLTASGGGTGLEYRWYDAATGGTVLSTDNPFTTVSLTSSTDFYAALYDPLTLLESTRTKATVTIINFSKPVLTPAGTAAVCSGSTLVVDAPAGFASYRWSKDGNTLAFTSQQILVTQAGTYSVETGDGTCFSSPSDALVVSVDIVPDRPAISGLSTVCGTGTVTLTSSGTGPYLWSTTETTQSITVGAGTYSVTVSNGACSSASEEFIVNTVPIPTKPIITRIGKEVICVGAVVALSAPAGFTHYVWSTGETTQTIVVTSTGSYTVQTGNAANCLSAFSDPVEVREGTSAECGLVQTPDNDAPEIDAASFGVKIQSEATHSLLPYIRDEDDNLDITTLRIITGPSQSDGKADIDGDQNLLLDYRNVNFAGTDYITLQVCDTQGLCTQQQVSIDVVGEVKVYNGVTPDGDGINDFMFIQFIDIIEGARSNRVTIMNRWGDIIFELENYDNATRVFSGNGTNGKELPNGTYLYKVDLSSGQTYSGFVTLKR
ncbi:MAG: gliding motility-associated C-terminal domain-containing protein [Cyclobacteriaceae bacterium]|nr:gliding motility-associated C-terminal domain-containing protein [Cyclobacteriaceae bacterium]